MAKPHVSGNPTDPGHKLGIPTGYLVPLRDDGAAARSYVLAFTHWLSPEEVANQLPAATNFTGHNIPFRAAEVRHLTLEEQGLQGLPGNVFARSLLSTFDWQTVKPGEFVAQFAAQHGEDGYLIPLAPFAVILREGPLPNEHVLGFPTGEGALWRDARVTICVDLDGMLRDEALRAARFIISDFASAAGVSGVEKATLDGTAMRWDSSFGKFLSPDDTRDRYQQERVEALDQLGDTYFRKPVHSARIPKVRPRVNERARRLLRLPIQEWREGRRGSLATVIPDILPRAFTTLSKEIAESPPRPLVDWAQRLSEFKAELVRKLRAALNNEMTKDYLDDNEWRREGRRVSLGNESAVLTTEDQASIDRDPRAIVINKYGALLVRRAHLTPTEVRVLATAIALKKGESLADWARANGMSPSTARVHRGNAKKKLEAAKKLT